MKRERCIFKLLVCAQSRSLFQKCLQFCSSIQFCETTYIQLPHDCVDDKTELLIDMRVDMKRDVNQHIGKLITLHPCETFLHDLNIALSEKLIDHVDKKCDMIKIMCDAIEKKYNMIEKKINDDHNNRMISKDIINKVSDLFYLIVSLGFFLFVVIIYNSPI